jgi:hypothetical protein
MKSALQPSLFDAEQPAAVECAGAELSALLADLKLRGAVPFAMTAICPGRWRLFLDWHDAEKMRFRSPGVQSG